MNEPIQTNSLKKQKVVEIAHELTKAELAPGLKHLYDAGASAASDEILLSSAAPDLSIDNDDEVTGDEVLFLLRDLVDLGDLTPHQGQLAIERLRLIVQEVEKMSDAAIKKEASEIVKSAKRAERKLAG